MLLPSSYQLLLFPPLATDPEIRAPRKSALLAYKNTDPSMSTPLIVRLFPRTIRSPLITVAPVPAPRIVTELAEIVPGEAWAPGPRVISALLRIPERPSPGVSSGPRGSVGPSEGSSGSGGAPGGGPPTWMVQEEKAITTPSRIANRPMVTRYILTRSMALTMDRAEPGPPRTPLPSLPEPA